MRNKEIRSISLKLISQAAKETLETRPDSVAIILSSMSKNGKFTQDERQQILSETENEISRMIDRANSLESKL